MTRNEILEEIVERFGPLGPAAGKVYTFLDNAGKTIGKWVAAPIFKLNKDKLGFKIFRFFQNPYIAPVAGGLAIAGASLIAYKGIKHIVLNHKSKTQAIEKHHKLSLSYQ